MILMDIAPRGFETPHRGTEISVIDSMFYIIVNCRRQGPKRVIHSAEDVNAKCIFKTLPNLLVIHSV